MRSEKNRPGDIGERSGRGRRRARDARPWSRSRRSSARRPRQPRALDQLEDGRHHQRGAAARNSIEDCDAGGRRARSAGCSRPSPPTNIAAPRTSRMLPMIEPMIEALTTSWRPWPSAKRAMISSGALPKVTLSRPPMPGPRPGGELLGRDAHQRGRRDDPERRDGEDQTRRGARDVERDRERDQRHEQVGPALRREEKAPPAGVAIASARHSQEPSHGTRDGPRWGSHRGPCPFADAVAISRRAGWRRR